MRNCVSRASNGESGQALVGFALLIMAIMGIAALAVDLGLLFGQRRFDQNGADSGALAAGRLLAGSVSLTSSGALYFGAPDVEVYRVVRFYAGLSPDDLASSVPTGRNQSAGLTTRNRLAVTLEYWTGTQWCYSPSGLRPPRAPDVPACALPLLRGPTGTLVAYPPLPDPNQPFKVRVTVSSTTNGFFAHVLGANEGGPTAPASDAVPACFPVAGFGGSTTCAHSVVAIRGSSTFLGVAPIIPPTVGDCQLAPEPDQGLFQLWGSAPNGCGYNLGPWKNVLDFTWEPKWCDAQEYDYRYIDLLPPEAHTEDPTSFCYDPGTPDADTTWNRGDFDYDRTWPGTMTAKVDVPYWIARGFGGRLRGATWDPAAQRYLSSSGIRFPTYVDSHPSQLGDMGQNIADGFYCGSSGVTDRSCDITINAAGTYFFAKKKSDGSPRDGYFDTCPDPTGYGRRFGVGCRDATVVTWVEPQWAVGLGAGGTGWASNGSGAPDRVMAARLLNFRIFCDHDTRGLCTQPPKSVVGNAANSSVWGMFVSPFIPGPCPTCTSGPSLNGNTAAPEF